MSDYFARAEAQIARSKRDFPARHRVAKSILAISGIASLTPCAVLLLGAYSDRTTRLLAFAFLAAIAIVLAALWARALIWKDQYLAEHTRSTMHQGEVFEVVDRLRLLADQVQDEAIYSFVVESTLAEAADARRAEDSYRAGVVAGVRRTFRVVGKSVEEGSEIKSTP